MKRVFCYLLILMLLLPLGTLSEAETAQYSPEELAQLWEWLGPQMAQAGIYPFPLVLLRRGDYGYEVMLLQVRLAQLGYYGKTIDPNFGSGTYNAMRMFEQLHGLTADGIATVEDQQLLFSASARYNTGAPAGGAGKPRLPFTPKPKAPPTPTGIKPMPMPIFDPNKPHITPTPTPKPKWRPGIERINPDLLNPVIEIITPTPKPKNKPGIDINPDLLSPGIGIRPGIEIITPTPKPQLRPGIIDLIPDLINPGILNP